MEQQEIRISGTRPSVGERGRWVCLAFSQKPRWFPAVSAVEMWGWDTTLLSGLVLTVRNEHEDEVLKERGINMSQLSYFG